MTEAKLDLALVHVTEPSMPRELADPRVEIELLFTEQLVLIAPPDHALRSRPRVAPAELRDESFIAFKSGSGLRRALYRLDGESGFTPRIVAECGDLGTIRGLVAAGLGVSLVPYSVAQGHGPSVAVVSLDPPPARTVLLIWHRDHQRSPAAEACLAFIRADVAEHPWG